MNQVSFGLARNYEHFRKGNSFETFFRNRSVSAEQLFSYRREHPNKKKKHFPDPQRIRLGLVNCIISKPTFSHKKVKSIIQCFAEQMQFRPIHPFMGLSYPQRSFSVFLLVHILLIEEILHQLICIISHLSKGFVIFQVVNRISSIWGYKEVGSGSDPFPPLETFQGFSKKR